MKNTFLLDMTLSSGGSSPTFGRNVAPPSSGSKDQLSVQEVNSCVYGRFNLDSEERGSMFLRNGGRLLSDNVAPYVIV
jgi:hypothetical protein